MHAKDVMTTRVVTIAPQTAVIDIARLLLRRNISAVPVVDSQGRIVGIVSEGDLMRRAETDTDTRRRSWWLSLIADPAALAGEYLKSHGLCASDVMTRNVITVDEDTPVAEIAQILEENHIKRVPVVHGGDFVGIVSRANLLRGFATRKHEPMAPVSATDKLIREEVSDMLDKEPWVDVTLINVTVHDGVVHLWGLLETEDQCKACEIAAAGISGVRSVENHLTKLMPQYYWS